MSVIFTDGFDMYNGANAGTGLPVRWVGTFNVGTTTGRFGGQALQLNSSNGGDISTRAVFDGSGTAAAMALGFAYKASSVGSNHIVHILNASLGLQCGIGVTSGGALFAHGSSFASPLATSAAGIIVANTWYYIEAEIVLHATAGSINLYLNGALVASATGVNTLPAGGGAAWLQPYTLGGGFQTFNYDDLYVTNSAARLGECKIETLRPTSDNTAVWTPSGGSNNYSRVNETLVDGESSYVETAATGQRDLYTIGALSSTPTSIKAVNVVSFAEKTDATTRQLYNSIKSGGTDDDGGAAPLAASYLRYDSIRNTDPATSAAWTPSGVNNLLIGPKAA